MNRREFIRVAASGGLCVATAGCAAGAPRIDARSETDVPDRRVRRHGSPSDICERPIHPDPGIPAILEPAVASDWSEHDIRLQYRQGRGEPALSAEQTVIGVTWGGGARAYPLSVLAHHEVVNDTVGEPLLITYCPLCSSGMVASRRLDGTVRRFAVSGELWVPEGVFAAASERDGRVFGARQTGGESADVRRNGNLVLYDDRSRSYWSQLLAAAICGPLAGTDLDIRPSTVATWPDWRAAHPETDVLLPPPHSETVEPGVVLGT